MNRQVIGDVPCPSHPCISKTRQTGGLSVRKKSSIRVVVELAILNISKMDLPSEQKETNRTIFIVILENTKNSPTVLKKCNDL